MQQGAAREREENKQRNVLMSSDTKANQEFIPMVFLLSTMIQQVEFSGQPLLCLLDSGATSSWIDKRKLPKSVVIDMVPTVSVLRHAHSALGLTTCSRGKLDTTSRLNQDHIILYSHHSNSNQGGIQVKYRQDRSLRSIFHLNK